MVTTQTTAEQRVLLDHISWQTFEAMLRDLGEERAFRLTYDQGRLEIMSPLMPHERDNRQLERLIFTLAEEMGLNIISLGSMTCRREDLERGAEPDSSYYIQNEPQVRDKEEIDLTQDPPPDLVVEVEYTQPAVNKLQLYAALGVPELWCYDGQALHIYKLKQGQYQTCESSPIFASIAVREIPCFLAQSRTIGEVAMVQSFRNWAREQIEN